MRSGGTSVEGVARDERPRAHGAALRVARRSGPHTQSEPRVIFWEDQHHCVVADQSSFIDVEASGPGQRRRGEPRRRSLPRGRKALARAKRRAEQTVRQPAVPCTSTAHSGKPCPTMTALRDVSFTILVHRARAQASSRDETLLYSSLAGAAAGVVGAGAGFAVQKTYFPVKTLGGMRAFFVMWTAFMPYMLVKGVTQNKMQKAARAAAVRD